MTQDINNRIPMPATYQWLAGTPSDRQAVMNEYILKEAEAAGIQVYVAAPQGMKKG